MVDDDIMDDDEVERIATTEKYDATRKTAKIAAYDSGYRSLAARFEPTQRW